jgi:hypothetical protein
MDSEETDRLAACTTITTPRDADLLPVLLEISASLKRLEARLAPNLSVEPIGSEEGKKGASVDKSRNEKKPLQNEEEDGSSYDEASLFSKSVNKETPVQCGEEIEAINDNASLDSKIEKEEARPSEDGDKSVNNRASLTSGSPNEEEGKALDEELGDMEGSGKQGGEVNQLRFT